MSDQNVSQPESKGSGSEQSSQTTQTRKPRSGGERLIVWGVIGVLLVLLLFEARARLGYSMTLTALQDFSFNSGSKGERLTLKNFESMASAFPSVSTGEQAGETRQVNYAWFSVFNKYRIELTVRSEEGNDYIASFSTPGEPEEEIYHYEELTPEQRKLLDAADPTKTGPGAVGAAPKKGKSKGKGGPGRQRPGGNLLGRLSEESVQSELGLTDEQKQKIEGLRDKYPVDFEQLREKSREEREAFFQERRTKIEEELNGILDEKQQEIWKNLSENSEDNASKSGPSE